MPGIAKRPSVAIALVILLAAGAFGTILAVARSPIFDLDRHAVPKELALHLTAFAGLLLLLPRWRWLEASMVEWLLALFLAWSGLSALASDNYWLGFRAWGISFSGVMIFLMARAARRAGMGRWVLIALAAATVTGALGGLLQAYGANWSLLQSGRPPGGTLGNRNFLAHLSVIAIPIVGLVTLTARRRSSQWIGMAGLAVLAAVIVLTRSRAAWLGGLASLAAATVAIWRSRVTPVDRQRQVGAALLVGTVAALVLPNRLAWRARSPYRESLVGLTNYQDGSGRGRLIQYRNTMELVVRNPVFGTGAGNWMIEYPLVTTPGDPSFAGTDPIPTNPWPSSDWIALIAERGVIGALLLLGAGLAATVIALRRLRNPAEAAEAVATLGLLAATLVTGLFDAVLLLAAPTLIVFAALGSLLPETRAVFTRPITGRRRMVAIGLPLLLSFLLLIRSAGQLTAIRITEQGRQRQTMENALRFDPGNYRLHLLLAMRGDCSLRMPHARVAQRQLPFHAWPRRIIEACR